MSELKQSQNFLRHWLLLFLALVVARMPLAHGEARAVSQEPVAEVLSKPVFANDIEPPEAQKARWESELNEEAYHRWLLTARSDRLGKLIWAALRTQFCAVRSCEPTDEEIGEFLKAMRELGVENHKKWQRERTLLEQELQLPDLLDDRKQAILKELQMLERFLTEPSTFQEPVSTGDREVALVTVGTWKFNKALYETYGGTVIFQQAGIEPLDAYRAALHEHERNGTFQIFDPELRVKFWEYFTTMPHTVLDEEGLLELKQMGLKHPFEKPWWLIKKKDAD